jgi:2,3-bisphosphoglycerate-independent phosphoglycerate mutase
MDRNNNWDRTGIAYEAMVFSKGKRANSALEAITASYAENVTDEFIMPMVIYADGKPVATVREGDALIHYNFRPDRARQLTKAFVMRELPHQAEGKWKREQKIPDLAYVEMTEYEAGLEAEVAFRADEVEMPIARVIADHGLRQFHTAETEKYAHVTYFINGRRETPFPGEERFMAPSPQVPTFDLQPEMNAAGITTAAVERIRSLDYDFIVMNYANADMVGHTGIIPATIKACEAVDTGVGKVVEAALAAGGSVIITADHGNAEQLIDYTTGEPFTAHTTNPVPFYLVAPRFAQAHLRSDGILADVAPTVLSVMGIPQPKDMSGRSLIES